MQAITNHKVPDLLPPAYQYKFVLKKKIMQFDD